MKRIDGFWWPEDDRECHAVVPNQLKDVNRALKWVPHKKVCIQAGGNVGVWPKYLSTIFDEVRTFEPDDDNYECLIKNISESNVTITKGALGAKTGTVGLKRVPKNCGAHQTEPSGEIPVFAVDALGLDRCDFIQLDIEGDELAALQGAQKTLEKFHPVLMLEDKAIKVPVGAVERFLQDFGYDVVDRVHRDIILCCAS